MFPANYYYPIFLHIILTWSLLQYFKLLEIGTYRLLKTHRNTSLITFFSILFIIIVGLRPISGYYFGDTVNYAKEYSLYQENLIYYDLPSSDWFFKWLMQACASIMNVHGFFLIIEIGYVVCILWTCKRLIPKNTTLVMLFCFGSFSFFSYGTNGIRNGLATSLVLLALSYIQGKSKDKIIAGTLCFAAFSIHKSTALPIICMIISLFYRKTKIIYAFWLSSILISAAAGGFLENIFSGLGFDDRLDSYIHNREYDDQFIRTGFRWDFLLYSAMPIWLGWYVVFKRKIYNSQYLLMLHTYVLSNAFWVMLIRASFSNRFAYLSWFMYPIVLGYPLLTFPIWKEQGKNLELSS